MKEKIIEAAGKTWKYLAENGSTEIASLGKTLKIKSELAFQALGWLAREDKINYTENSKKTYVSLIDSEVQAFKNVIAGMQESKPGNNGAKRSSTNRLKSLEKF